MTEPMTDKEQQHLIEVWIARWLEAHPEATRKEALEAWKALENEVS